MKRPFIFLIALVFLISCEMQKQDETPQPGTMIHTIHVDGELFIEHEFDEQGRLSNYTINATRYEHSYPGDSMKVSVIREGELKLYELFYLFEENVYRQDRFLANGERTAYWIYTFSPGICAFVNIKKFVLEDVLNQEIRLAYKPGACSYTASYFGSDGQLDKTETVKIDQQNFYGSPYMLDFFKVEGYGNKIEYILTDQAGKENTALSFRSTFLYNEDGFPVREEKTYLNGERSISEYSYY